MLCNTHVCITETAISFSGSCLTRGLFVQELLFQFLICLPFFSFSSPVLFTSRVFYSFNFLLSSPFSFSVSFLSRLSSFLILFYFINVSFVPLIGHNQKNLLRARPSENNESLKFIFSSKYHQVPGIMICQRSKRK